MNKAVLLFSLLYAAGGWADAPALLDRAKVAANEKRLDEAVQIGRRVLKLGGSEAVREEAVALLNRIGLPWLYEQAPAATYAVQSGDILGWIARRHKVTVDLIRKSNGIKGSSIRIGQKLRIPRGRFSLHVDKSDNRMTLYLDGAFLKRYVVATGKNNKTPVGTYTITDRVERPTWWRPSDKKKIPFGDPENELGTHWLAWSLKGFGIHGTWDNDSLGTQASAGCVRMHNDEVAEIFTLAPLGTTVTVAD